MFVFFACPFSLFPLHLPIKKRGVKIKNFFLTFFDALLAVFQTFNINKSSIILMPNFYCPSTLKAINAYADIKFYEINDDFSVNKNDYFQKIIDYHPDVILNYSFTGSFLDHRELERLRGLCKQSTIIIEDCAHRILNYDDIQFIHKNHFYINSCRKHSPFFGSHLVTNHDLIAFKNADLMNGYKIKLRFLQFLDECLSFWAYLFSSKLLYSMSEKIFEKSDALAGMNARPTRGGIIDYFLYNLLNLKKIKSHKKQIISLYNEKFSKINAPGIHVLKQESPDGVEFNYYPLFVEKNIQNKFIQYLKKHNIFAGQLWESQEIHQSFKNKLNVRLYDSFIVFPLTWLIKKKEIDYITSTVENFFKPMHHAH